MKRAFLCLLLLCFLSGCAQQVRVRAMNLYSLGISQIVAFGIKEEGAGKGAKVETFSLGGVVRINPEEEVKIKVVIDNFPRTEKASFFLLKGKEVALIEPQIEAKRVVIEIPYGPMGGTFAVVIGSRVESSIIKLPPDSVWVGKVKILLKEVENER